MPLIAASIEPGLGEGVPAGDPESFAARVLVRDGSVISLVTYGSSSCPFKVIQGFFLVTMALPHQFRIQ